MKIVMWTDDRGYKHRSLLRDSDPDELAPKGIPQDPPDLDELDWEGLKKDLHNALVERGLATWEDVLAQQNGVTSAIKQVFKRPMVYLYRDGG